MRKDRRDLTRVEDRFLPILSRLAKNEIGCERPFLDEEGFARDEPWRDW